MTLVDIETATLRALAGEASHRPEELRALIESSGVESSDFAEPQARALFEAMLVQISASKGHLDIARLVNSVGPLVKRDYVVEVMTRVELGQAAGRLAALKEASTNRQTRAVLRSAIDALAAGLMPTGTAIAELRRALDAIATPGDSIRPLSAEILGMVEAFEAARRGASSVVETGIVALDAYMGGLQPGVLTLIGSLPSVGKSALIATILRNLGKRRVHVGCLSLEDNREWILERAAAEEGSVPVFLAANRPRDLVATQVERYNAAFATIYENFETVFVDDAEDRPRTLDEVVSRATSMVMRHGCKALLVDHLGEIRIERSARHDLDILEVAIALRSVAKTHNVPVVLACHFRRRAGLMLKTDAPVLTDFAFSAGLERCARVALGLHRVEEDADALRVVILKQTKGVSDISFDLELNKSAAMVLNADRTGAVTAAKELYTPRGY